jgi:hypothetical protein
MPMDVELAQLVNSFSEAGDRYTLARLEIALRYPGEPAPPLMDRLEAATEYDLRSIWARIQTQLHEALAFAARHAGYRLLLQSVRELDHYARALAWMLTISERP